MKPVSIGMIIARFPPYIGGTEIQCYRLSRELVRRGHRVTVLTEQLGHPWPNEETRAGIQVRRFSTWGRPPFSSLIFALKLLNHLRRENTFDLFHSYIIAVPALSALWHGRKTRKPVVVKIAGADKTGEIYTSQQTVSGRIKFHFFRRWSRFIVCPSRQAIRELTALGIEEKTISLIPNGVDIDQFSIPSAAARRSARKSLGFTDDDLVAVYAGRPAVGKGVDTLMEIWTTGARKVGFRWKLLMLLALEGKPSVQEERALARLKDRVFVFYNQSEILRYYHAADIALLLSRGEGLSNFLLETMACGIPHVTTPNAAITDDVQRQRWSWILELNDEIPMHILELLNWLQENPDPIREKGSAARRAVERDYSIQRTTDAYERVYERMLGRL